MIRNTVFKYSLFLLLTGMVIFTQSCRDKCEEVMTYTVYEPVYMTLEDLRQPISNQAPRALENPGKIYFYSPYLLINERNEGIHVIDNSDPTNPQNITFIAIPGNVDMAVKSNVLYADNHIDLLSIDISDPTNANLLSRTENVYIDNYQTDPDLGIVVDYNEIEVTEAVDCSSNGWRAQDDIAVFESNTNGNSSAPTQGVGGSMARFTLVGDFLYIVTNVNLQTYSLANPFNPVQSNTILVGNNIETIFPFNGHLLIGSQSGMFIYELSDPAAPAYTSEFIHIQSCDPVVAEGDLAFVTLRGGNLCGGWQNQLDIIDISNMNNPMLLVTHPMVEPYGLGIDNGTLFICDGSAGLKIYSTQDIFNIEDNQIAAYPDIDAYDVIPFNNVLLMIGEDGFFQYDYSDLNNISLLSSIPVER